MKKETTITVRVPVSESRTRLEKLVKMSEDVDLRIRHYIVSGLVQEMVDGMENLDVLVAVHDDVVKASRSSYTLTRGEFKKGLARAILGTSKVVHHNRGTMPNAYKYSPTSQCVGFTVEKLKTMYRIKVKQLSSN